LLEEKVMLNRSCKAFGELGETSWNTFIPRGADLRVKVSPERPGLLEITDEEKSRFFPKVNHVKERWSGVPFLIA
jgi:hypothetical protein